MARIPIGNFGNAIPDAAPLARIPTPQTGRGLEQLGNTGIQLAEGMMQDQAFLAEKKRQEDAALTRAKAANVVLDREIAVKTTAQTIEQQVADGTIHYNDAPTVYKQRIQDLGLPDMKGFDPVSAENVTRGFKRLDFIGETMIGGAVEKAKKADFRTQADSAIDSVGKLAGMPGTDVAKVNAQLDSLDTLGSQAYGGEWGKVKQNARDKNWNDHITQQVMQSRSDMKALSDLEARVTTGDLADKIDSEKRNTQIARIVGFKTALAQQQEAAAARAERQAEHRLHVAEAEFNTFQAMADKGTVLDPAYVDRVAQVTAGTPYQAGIKAIAQQAKETGGMAMQPVMVQQATLDAVDRQIATSGRSPELDKRREQISKVLEGSQRDLQDKGIRAGLERGVITALAPIKTDSPEAFSQSIADRLNQSELVGRWAGKPVSPLTPEEAGQLKSMLDVLPPKNRAAAVATMAQSVGPRASGAIAMQLDKQDRALGLAFASAGAKTTAGRYTSELILKGATAIKDGTVMKDDKKVTGWKATIATQLDGVYPNEQLTQATKDAAYYIAAGFAQENGGMVSERELAKSVRLAVGGDIIERNGKKLPIPAGMDEKAFEQRMQAVTAADITKQATDGKIRVGGAVMSAEDFTKALPGQELMYAGPGRYAVIVKGRPVVNSAGVPIIIGVH